MPRNIAQASTATSFCAGQGRKATPVQRSSTDPGCVQAYLALLP